MTVPTLMQNYQKKSYVTQLHKVYNELSQALLQYQTDRNAVNLREAGLTSLDALDSMFKQYFKIVQDCGTDLTPCFAESSSYRYINGNSLNPVARGKHVALASGAAIKYEPGGENDGLILIRLFVDVNGKQGPNIAGRDMFAIYVYEDGKIDDYSKDNSSSTTLTEEQREDAFNNVCLGNTSGGWWGCFGKLLNDNWEMNY